MTAVICVSTGIGLRNLDSLVLAHNQLSKVPANVFSHLTLLNSLELEGNQINYVDKDAFAGLEGRPQFVDAEQFGVGCSREQILYRM